MSRAGSQQRTLIGILARLRPHWGRDPALPARVDALLGRDRRLGSRDRRAYRELVYTAVRYLPWIEPLLDSDPPGAVRRIAWLASDTESLQSFRAEVAGDLPECPADAEAKARVLGTDAGALTPSWLAAECPEALGPPLRDVLLSRAPLWLRMQTPDTDSVFRELDRLGWAWSRSPVLAGAVRVPLDAKVAKTDAYASGKVEIQDVGSQLVLESAGISPGGRWLDACAGSGGKTLQLASLLGPGGRVDARDARAAPLRELSERAKRAGLAERIEVGGRAEPPGGYDGVLVDAPCTGSGTWRRSPHLRWATTPQGVPKASAAQAGLLRENALLVRPGGLLVYATCSLCRSENESVAADFLEGSPGFESAQAPRRLWPQDHDGDGFFVASFRRTARP